MSITINIYYSGTNGNAKKFAEEMQKSGTTDFIRKENGNIRYDYFISMANSETILLIDAWENQEALDAHHASPIMKTISYLREKYNLRMTVERYISNENDIPAKDKNFIKS